MRKTTKRLYLIPVLSKALDILELLQHENQQISLEAIYRKTKISKTTVYRILKTFVHRGYVSQSQDGLVPARLPSSRKVRFGFGSQSSEMPFSNAVTASLEACRRSQRRGFVDTGQQLPRTDRDQERRAVR